jgi:hypothetical protein
MKRHQQRTEIMNVLRITRWCTLTALVPLVTLGVNHYSSAARQGAPTDQDGVEVLTRGPVHEAFAETITFDPQPGIVVPKAPPAAIEEVPPLQRPEGGNVSWIPGYWGWDDERNDFLWISGIWRALPPSRQWEPGYWGQSRQGVQWTSAATSPDQNWLPGCWVWQQNRYAWRPGYWAAGNQDWDWVPDHYVWTPSGYVFVDGYYDYSVPRRGVLFAPVYFDGGLRNGRGFTYSPSIVIDPGVFVSHLFLRPGYGHYYFGDYYGSNYSDAGFSPWFSYQSSRRGYDPIYANQRWQHRQDRGWENRTASNFRQFRDNADTRPPHTWAAQKTLEARTAGLNKNRHAVATSFDELAQRKDNGQRFQPVDTAEQKLPRSPFVATPVDQLGGANAPPKRHEVLKPDVQVQPQTKRSGGTPRITNGQKPVAPEISQQNQSQRKVGQQGQQGQQQVKPQATSKGQSQVQGTQRGQRGQSQGASNGQSQNSSQGQPSGKPKKKDKD